MKKILTGLCLILCIFSFTSCQNEVKNPSNMDLIKTNRYVDQFDASAIYANTYKGSARYEIDDEVVTLAFDVAEKSVFTFNWQSKVLVFDPDNAEADKKVLLNNVKPSEEDLVKINELKTKLTTATAEEYAYDRTAEAIGFKFTTSVKNTKDDASRTLNFKGKKFSYSYEATEIKQAGDSIMDSVKINGMSLTDLQMEENYKLINKFEAKFF